MAEKPLKPGQIQVAGSTVLVNADGQVVRCLHWFKIFQLYDGVKALLTQ